MEEQWVTSVPLSQGWRDGERVREREQEGREESITVYWRGSEKAKREDRKKRQRIKKDRVRERG